MDCTQLECSEVHFPDIVVTDVVLQNVYLVLQVTRLIYKCIVIVLDILAVSVAGKKCQLAYEVAYIDQHT